MILRLLKGYAYAKKPRTTFVVLHPKRAAQIAKVPFDLRTAYAPRLTALATAILVAPLAYRLGKRLAGGPPPAVRDPAPGIRVVREG